MKTIYAVLFCLLISLPSLFAQIPGIPNLDSLGIPTDSTSVITGPLDQDPTGVRFRDPVFSSLVYTTGIPYGAAPLAVDSLNSDTIPLYPLTMDVYQPFGIAELTAEPRPVIVFAFGGSFVYGAKQSPDIVQLCSRLAQLGYVTISIDYRLSDELLINPTPSNAFRAVAKGMHDMKAAVRFLRMQEETLANVLNIDTKRIYVGGVSAGAFAALHTTYLDESDMLPAEFQPLLEEVGGLEGNSGNPGFSSEVAACINLCGGLGLKEWLDAGEPPLISMHGDQDGTVPYDSDTIRALDINYPVDGSAAIKRRADEVRVKNPFYTFKGADHTPFILPGLITESELAYMDTTFEFIRDHMFEIVNGRITTVAASTIAATEFDVYPNPANDQVSIFIKEGESHTLKIISLTGKTVYTAQINHATSIDVSQFPRGIYMIQASNGTTNSTKKIVLR